MAKYNPKAKVKKGRAHARHIFVYEVISTDGKKHTMEIAVKVKYAKTYVQIELTAEHVRRSIAMHGAGDASNCAMAICAMRHAKAFPHPVTGHMDWHYTRVWVVSKVTGGQPSECVQYEHRDSIAKLNDSLDGQRKLLAELEKNGPRIINLMPPRQRSTPGRSGGGRVKTGARDPQRQLKLRGVRLRQATAQAGGQGIGIEPKKKKEKELA